LKRATKWFEVERKTLLIYSINFKKNFTLLRKIHSKFDYCFR
jgi:hypothetical protein